jgi:dihydrofolate synthase/folylpolyglutamate synthase
MTTELETLLARMGHPSLPVIDPGLARVEQLLGMLGSPHLRLPPVIHVAGTNGKGALLAYLQAIFQAAGYRVHRYSSPHLVRFNERIILNGQEIGDESLLDVLRRVHACMETLPVTFFESTTAAAFLAFSETPADVLLLETGMGGRWDATNVVDAPALTAITPVSLDHCNFLGNSLAEIAGEKAGIIKPGVACVVGRQEAEAAHVLMQRADALGAPLYRMGRGWQLVWHGNRACYESPERLVPVNPSLAGRHQYDNAATAIACVDKLPQFSITNAHIAEGLAQAVWPARLQRLDEGRLADMLPQGVELWLDGGHNPQGGEMLAAFFTDKGISEVYLICGMVKGKDSPQYLKPMAPFVKKLFAVAIAGEEQSQPAEQVQMAAGYAGIDAVSAQSVENALQTIGMHAKTPAIACICGSLYLAGKVLAANTK